MDFIDKGIIWVMYNKDHNDGIYLLRQEIIELNQMIQLKNTTKN